ncbi:MAG: putative sugar nucleotidyl transferase [Candidatus Cloacimonadota bacterium]|nr:putative sugar nucleotidyl transferase [Candidatus Cloacimonadota bacterium]
MQLVVFDDKNIDNFYPLTLTRSIGDLRVGILKQRQRIASFFQDKKIGVWLTNKMVKLYQERYPTWQINHIFPGEVLLINSRLKVDKKVLKKIEKLQNQVLKFDKQVVAAQVSFNEEITDFKIVEEILANLSVVEIKEECLWNYLWEMVAENSDNIQQDFDEYFYDKDNFFETETGVTVLNPYNIWLGEDVKLYPGVILDASKGAIVIDERAKVFPGCYIQGPCFIGKNSVIKALSKIYEGTSIGPVCKIGGEIEESIIQAYSNKQHEGFLGHSYLGEWVNLGAGTSNSDLKNNYGTVQVYSYLDRKKIDSKQTFVGTFIGDHSKTAINSSINTGTVIGVACNLFGNQIISGFIPDFSWGNVGGLSNYKLEKFLQTADLVKRRRQLHLSEAEKELYTNIYWEKFDY